MYENDILGIIQITFIDIVIFAEDGRLKYKVSFEEKGRSLVSGHHIAFDTTPNLEQLYVGARVVVGSQDKSQFRPGILAELPSRKNRLRFVKGLTSPRIYKPNNILFNVKLSFLFQVLGLFG